MLSFIWDMTHWNRMDIKNAAGGKPQKYKIILCTLNKFGSIGVHNAMHITIDWNQSASHYQRWNGLTWDSIDCYMHGIVCTKGVKFVQSLKINLVLLFGFLPVAILISISQPIMFQMKERKHISEQISDILFLSSGYYIFWVMIDWISCQVTFFLAHSSL